MQTLRERLETLADDAWLLITAPAIAHYMAGTTRVGIMKDGLVKVAYEDGTIEERPGSDAILNMDADEPSLFAIVEFVQEGRTPTCSLEYQI